MHHKNFLVEALVDFGVYIDDNGEYALVEPLDDSKLESDDIFAGFTITYNSEETGGVRTVDMVNGAVLSLLPYLQKHNYLGKL